MNRRRSAIAVAVIAPVAVLAMQWAVVVEHLLLAANAVAVLAILALMGVYTRYTAWWSSPVGLSTMALKGSILVLGVGGLLRRIAEQLALAGSMHTPAMLHTVANHIAFAGWVLIAASSVWRLVVMWPYLRRADDRTPARR